MTIVYVYGGSGIFEGERQFKWKSPAIGSQHKFMLFLAQEVHENRCDLALAELEQFGFSEIELFEGRPVRVEALNQPEMRAFQKHYEGAFTEGSSLVWYP